MTSVVVFDFDGTIADTLDAVVHIANHLADEFGYQPVGAEEVKRLRHMSSREVIQQSKIPFIKIPFLVRKVRTELKAQIPTLKPVSGMPETLKQLKQQGNRMGIITSNSEENVIAFLKSNEMKDAIDFVYSGVSLFGKGRLIRRFLKESNLPAESVLYVGDETRDIEAAKRAGTRAVAVTWGFNSREVLTSHRPDFLVDRPEELIAIAAGKAL
ncbi:MAG: HAD-IA family hydrolase [Leptolyngbyaceae cyanobacterium bins.59]|nr:HAD-IA family hydrolase [Leptolyngbyaceae cyanobacterium bins.59]